MNLPSTEGIALGRLCPCGKGVVHRCAWCHRALCEWHSASGPFEEDGQVVLRPVCLPKCDALWWYGRGE